MKRYSLETKYIKYFFRIIFFTIYEILTSVIVQLPPLMGLCFAHMILEYSKKQQRSYFEFGFNWYFGIAFLLFCEQIHGFYMFSSIISFFIFYNLFVDWLFATMKYRNLLLVIFVTVGYIGAYSITNTINYIQNLPFLPIGIEYLIYIIIESFIAITLFKERIL